MLDFSQEYHFSFTICSFIIVYFYLVADGYVVVGLLEFFFSGTVDYLSPTHIG